MPDIDTAFEIAMNGLGLAYQITKQMDWEALLRQIDHAEGAGAVLDPGAFMDIQADTQWEAKKRVFRAAANFVREMGAVQAELFPETMENPDA